MTTFAELLESPDRSVVVWAEIEGVGDTDGVWRFCVTPGWTLGAGEGTWLPILAALPAPLSIKAPVTTGGTATEGGNLLLQILDDDDRLTEYFQTDRAPSTYTTAATITQGATIVQVDGIPPEWAVGQLLYLGKEVVRITSLDAVTVPNVVGIARGELKTTPSRFNGIGTPVFEGPSFLEYREVRLFVAPRESSDAEAQPLGVYVIRKQRFDREHATWLFDAESRSIFLDRIIPRGPRSARLTEDGRTLRGLEVIWPSKTTAVLAHQSSDELVRFDATVGEVVARGVSGTEADGDDVEPGEWFVVPSVEDGDFRYQLADASGRGTLAGVWETSSSWVDVVLCLLLSSPFESDAPDNYDATLTAAGDFAGRNYSGLSGYGVGVPFSAIDWASFDEARARRDFALPFFVLRPSPRKTKEILDDVLKLVGGFLFEERGQLRLGLSGLPLAGDTVAVMLDERDVLSGGGDEVELETRRHAEGGLAGVLYTFGNGSKVLVATTDFAALVDPEGLYGAQAPVLDIDASALDPDDEGLVTQLGRRRLWRALRRTLEVSLELDPGRAFAWRVGQNALLTLPGLVNYRTGQRGVVNAITQLLEEEQTFDEDGGWYLTVRALVQPSERLGRIAPAAVVESVAGDVATVAANRYTAPDSPASLPRSDAAAFQVGDLVQLRAEDRQRIGSATETVQAVGANTLELSGDFSGLMVAGTRLVVPPEPEATLRQRERYVFFDASPVWTYAE